MTNKNIRDKQLERKVNDKTQNWIPQYKKNKSVNLEVLQIIPVLRGRCRKNRHFLKNWHPILRPMSFAAKGKGGGGGGCTKSRQTNTSHCPTITISKNWHTPSLRWNEEDTRIRPICFILRTKREKGREKREGREWKVAPKWLSCEPFMINLV